VGGPIFNADGTPSLRSVLTAAAVDIPYPGNTSTSVLEHWGGHLNTLGSGSDYTVFIDHLGVASINMGFGGLSSGIYHSSYDSFAWMNEYGDPGFLFHKGMSQLTGLVVLRLANAAVLPHNYSSYAESLTGYTAKVQRLAESFGVKVDFAPIQQAINDFSSTAVKVENEKLKAGASTSSLNDRLMLTERQFLAQEGLPGRPWFRHVIQAPGLYLGYGADEFPGIAQAIRDENTTLAQQQILTVAQRIRAASSILAGSSDHGGLTTGAIVGIVIGSILAVGLIVGIAYFVWQRKKSQYQRVN